MACLSVPPNRSSILYKEYTAETVPFPQTEASTDPDLETTDSETDGPVHS